MNGKYITNTVPKTATSSKFIIVHVWWWNSPPYSRRKTWYAAISLSSLLTKSFSIWFSEMLFSNWLRRKLSSLNWIAVSTQNEVINKLQVNVLAQANKPHESAYTFKANEICGCDFGTHISRDPVKTKLLI